MGVEQTKNYDNLGLIDALASSTGNFVGTGSGPAISAAAPKMQANAITENIKDAGQKLDTIGRLRDMAVTAVNEGGGESKAPLNSPEGMRGMIASNLVKLGIAVTVGMINPAAGAAMGMGAAVSEGVTTSMQGAQHAALGGAPTSFKVTSSADAGKSKSAMPDENGWQYGQTPAVSPALQASAPKMSATDLQAEQETVNRVVASRGRDSVAEELGGMSTAEDKLLKKVKAARDLALEKFGIDSPDMIVQRSGPQLAQSPQPDLGVAPPKVAGPKAFGGIFG